MMNKIALALTISLFSSHILADVTNVEFTRTDLGTKDFHADVQLEIDGESGNHEKTEFNTGLALAWKEGSGFFLMLLEHKWRNGNNKVDKNQSYIHLRYTKQLPSGLGNNVEFYLQSQQDKFRSIKSRTLGGIGYRKELNNKPLKRKNAFGIGAFYESERAVDSVIKGDEDTFRGNMYWHHAQNINLDTTIENVIYVQPSLSKIDDFRILNEVRLSHAISEHISVGFSLSIAYDSEPIEAIKKNDTKYGSYIKYTF